MILIIIIESVILKRPYLHEIKTVRKRKKLFLEIKIKFRQKLKTC
jgi:hypothetical protein